MLESLCPQLFLGSVQLQDNNAASVILFIVNALSLQIVNYGFDRLTGLLPLMNMNAIILPNRHNSEPI